MNNEPQNKPIPNWLQLAFVIGGTILIAYLIESLLNYLFYSQKDKRRRVFVSHSWDHDKDYKTLIRKFDDYGFEYYNHSIPESNAIDKHSSQSIEEGIRRKIQGCSSVLVLGGPYSNNYWIKKEVEIAKEFGKKIIAIRPWGQSEIPIYLKDNADQIVGFNSKSIIEKIK